MTSLGLCAALIALSDASLLPLRPKMRCSYHPRQQAAYLFARIPVSPHLRRFVRRVFIHLPAPQRTRRDAAGATNPARPFPPRHHLTPLAAT